MNDLDRRVRDLVGGLTDTPPRPRPWVDVRRRAGNPAASGTRRRGRFTIVAAVGAAGVIAGIAVLSVRHDDHRSITPVSAVPEPTSPTNTVTAPSTDTAPFVSAVPGGIATNPSVPSTTAATVVVAANSVGDPVIAGQLTAINSAALTAQRGVASFRATVTLTSSTTQADGTITANTAETNTVTFMSDGRLWSTGDRHLWTSYDPTTGIQQAAVLQPDGSTAYQKVTNVADPMLGDNVFGYSPTEVALGTGPDYTTTVRDTEQAGRAAWEVTSRYAPNPAAPVSATSGTAVEIIDKQTGLVSASRSTFVTNGITTRHDSEFTALQTGVDLPAAYPGVLGPNVTVTHGDAPVATGPLSPTDAAAWFASTIYAPSNLPADATIGTAPEPAPALSSPAFRSPSPTVWPAAPSASANSSSPTQPSCNPPRP